MIALVALLIAAALPVPTISAGERAELLLFVSSPAAVKERVPSRALFAAATAAFSETAVAIKEADAADALEECPADERIQCWTARASRSRYLLVIGVLPLDSGEELSAIFLDVERARRAPRREGGGDAIEAAMFASAISAPPKRIRAADPRALEAYFRALLDDRMRAALEANGDASALGAIAVESVEPELNLELDGKRLGTVAKSVRIVDVRPGTRALVIEKSDGTREQRALAVESGREARVSIAALALAHPLAAPTMWAGAGVAAGGVAIALGALVAGAGSHRASCVVRGAGDGACPENIAVGLTGLSDRVILGDQAFAGRGVPLAALGLGLAAGGAIALSGTAAFEVCEREPWWCWGAALLGGAAAFVAGATIK